MECQCPAFVHVLACCWHHLGRGSVEQSFARRGIPSTVSARRSLQQHHDRGDTLCSCNKWYVSEREMRQGQNTCAVVRVLVGVGVVGIFLFLLSKRFLHLTPGWHSLAGIGTLQGYLPVGPSVNVSTWTNVLTIYSDPPLLPYYYRGLSLKAGGDEFPPDQDGLCIPSHT